MFLFPFGKKNVCEWLVIFDFFVPLRRFFSLSWCDGELGKQKN